MKLALSLLFVLPAIAWANLGPLKSIELADGRTIVADSSSMTVYTFDIDNGSTSNCYDKCAAVWPPVLVAPGTVVEAPLGLTTRKDGSLQITVHGKPIYLFINDQVPGDINGDGLDGVWHIIER